MIRRILPRVLCLTLLGAATRGPAADVYNLTGLPAYPHLSAAKMDAVSKTDALGRWCSRFAGYTVDPLETVAAWYRGALRGASETDLHKDAEFAGVPALSGIKLALGIDYVAVFTLAYRSGTSIELFKCSPP